jgi:hypothetical protein
MSLLLWLILWQPQPMRGPRCDCGPQVPPTQIVRIERDRPIREKR